MLLLRSQQTPLLLLLLPLLLLLLLYYSTTLLLQAPPLTYHVLIDIAKVLLHARIIGENKEQLDNHLFLCGIWVQFCP